VSSLRAQQRDMTRIQHDAFIVNTPRNTPRYVAIDKERKAFGHRVLQARLESGARQKPPRAVTQGEIADAMGTTSVTVGRWESGRAEPDLGTIHKLAFVLSVRPAWLAWGEEPMRAESAPPPPRRQGRSA
jgi:DNA-binding XRE family transcriptional regulator